MVGICGLEPQTSSLSVTRSNQLSYIPCSLYSSRHYNFTQAFKSCYNVLMQWSFDFGWFLGGIAIAAAGAALVIFYRQIADEFLGGVSKYDKVKLVGIIIAIFGFICMANLHTLLLYFIFHLIMPNAFPYFVMPLL